MSDKATQNGYRPRLLADYQERIRPSLMDELKLKNVMEVPRLLKVVLNMGVGEGSRDEKILQAAEEDLALISGQKPRRTRAKISVAAFKLR
ncbi:MAG TPA: 50S ribosomal protein L5, partial [Candidatus Sumerlaeota bacterium]|nr:50S ribosomal protein L5 [Candidatus Sumerlaeota bacterium]